MKKFFSLLLAVLLVTSLLPISASATEKTIITEIRATYQFTKPTYGQEITFDGFEFTVEGDIPVTITTSGFDWYKYFNDDWNNIENGYFNDGTWCHDVYLDLTDTENYEYDQVNGTKLIINGVEWADDVICEGWVNSPAFTVDYVAGALELFLFNGQNYQILDNYIGVEIDNYSFANYVVGGTKPYTFSKSSGPDWINVSTDGNISGTPTTVGTNEDLVITVTDSLGATDSLDIAVDETHIKPEDREVVSRVVGTIDIPEFHCGDSFELEMETNVTEGSPATISTYGTDFYVIDENGEAGEVVEVATYGQYIMDFFVAIDDDAGYTHVLDEENLEIIVNGVTCTHNGPVVQEDESYVWARISPITVDHVFDNDTDATCNGCEYTREGCDHQYDNQCDAICNVCGESRVITHEYDYSCDDTCNLCGFVRDDAYHEYTNCYDKYCDNCNFEREPGECVFDDCYDDTCNLCGDTRYVPAHVYDSSLDTQCNACGDIRTLNYINSNETKDFELAEGQIIEFVFQCVTSGTYTYRSQFPDEDNNDGYGLILNTDGEVVAEDDDSGGNRQFLMEYDFVAGNTYILVARFYSSDYSGTGSISLISDDLPLGDLDNDSSVTYEDTLLCLQAAVGKVTLNEIQIAAADVDGSGDVAYEDALLILQYAVGKLTTFPG